MSREKQIEELKEILLKECGATPNGKCINKSCSECRAETVIEAGYRRQSEGEWVRRYSEHTDHLGTFKKYDGDFCSICGVLGSGNFCPNCGARMKGGE
jgi:hypothetical protein